MAKQTYPLILTVALLLSSCQSIEQLSIDYMLPAEVSFPASLKRVAVVNNMPAVPENKLIVSEEAQKKSENEMARLTNYYNGDAKLTTEALAEALAQENYFEEIVICDSALRSKDVNPRENALMQEEVQQLVQDLNVDFLIALENIQLRSIRKISYIRDWASYYGTVDVRVLPTVKIYLPNRKGPMVTVNSNDSIFWEEYGSGEATLRSRLISEEKLIEEASVFAGTIPVKHLLPFWKTANRYYFTGGSVGMRDAAVYAKEGKWDEAVQLWRQNYEAKKGKKKMHAAFNVALGYEMQDSIEAATEWVLKAQTIARQIDKVDELQAANGVTAESIPNFYLTTLYMNELQERKEGMARLNVQMNRFDEH